MWDEKKIVEHHECQISKKVRKGPTGKARSFAFHFPFEGSMRKVVLDAQAFKSFYVYNCDGNIKIEIHKNKRAAGDTEAAQVLFLPAEKSVGVMIDEDWGSSNHRLFMIQSNSNRYSAKKETIADPASANYEALFNSMINGSTNKICEVDSANFRIYTKDKLPKGPAYKANLFCAGKVKCKEDFMIKGQKIPKGDFSVYCTTQGSQCPDTFDCLKQDDPESDKLKGLYDFNKNSF